MLSPPPTSRSSPWEPVRDVNYQAPPRPTDSETAGVGSASLPGDSEGLTASGQSSSLCGAREERNRWTKLRSGGTVDHRTLGPLALPPPSTGQGGEKKDQNLTPGDSWLYTEGSQGCHQASAMQRAVRKGRSHVLSVCNPPHPGGSLEVAAGAEGLKWLTWHIVPQNTVNSFQP